MHISPNIVLLNDPNYTRVDKNDVFFIKPNIKTNAKKNYLLKSALKFLAASTITYQANTYTKQNKGDVAYKKGQNNLFPSIGFGLLAATPDLIKAVKDNSKQLKLRFSLFNDDSVLVYQEIHPIKNKGNQVFKGAANEKGYLQVDIISTLSSPHKLENIFIRTMTKQEKFKGSIAENFALRTDGECNPEVCVKSSTHETHYEPFDIDHMWLVTCTTQYENCDDNYGFTSCTYDLVYTGNGGSTGNNPYTETITVQNGCQLCSVIVTHNTNGDPDEYSAPSDCVSIANCGEYNDEGNIDSLPCIEVSQEIKDAKANYGNALGIGGNILNGLFNTFLAGSFPTMSNHTFSTNLPPSINGNTYSLSSDGHFIDQNNKLIPALTDPSTGITYISPYVLNQSFDYIINELFHELMHQLMYDKGYTFDYYIQESIIYAYQADMWKAWGNSSIAANCTALSTLAAKEAAGSVSSNTYKEITRFHNNDGPKLPNPPCQD